MSLDDVNIQNKILSELHSLADSQRAYNLQRYFKTGKGEYGEGDLFLGLKVPQVRHVVRKYWKDISLGETQELLHSKFHEVRLCALLILVEKFNKAGSVIPELTVIPAKAGIQAGSPIGSVMTPENTRKNIFDIYISNTKYINNWDLVDQSAGYIVGHYLADKPKDFLYKFAKSNSLWERRISIIATLYFIVFQKKSEETIKIAKILLHPSTKLRAGDHDLIHKAVGWMLREVGKRCDEKILTDILDEFSHQMPRTMLRYAIERLPEKQRLYYLGKKL